MLTTVIKEWLMKGAMYTWWAFEVQVFQNDEYLDSYFVFSLSEAMEKALNLVVLR